MIEFMSGLSAARDRLIASFRGMVFGVPSNFTHRPPLAGTGLEPEAPAFYDRLGDATRVAAIDEDGIAAVAAAQTGRFDAGFLLGLEGQTGVDDNIRESLAAALAVGFPPGSIFAVTAYGSPLIDHAVRLWAEARTQDLPGMPTEADDFRRRQTAARSEMFLSATTAQRFPNAPVEVRTFRVYLSVVVPGFDPENDEDCAKLRHWREALLSILSQAALSPRILTADDYLAAAGEMLNPQLVRARAWQPRRANPYEDLRTQLVSRFTVAEVTISGVRFSGLPPDPKQNRFGPSDKGAVTAIGLAVEDYAGPVSLLTTANLLGEPGRAGAQIPCPFALTTIVEIPNETAERANVERRHLRARQMAGTPLGMITPWYAEQARELARASMSFKEGGVARMLQTMTLFAPEGREAQCCHAAIAIARRAQMTLEPSLAMHAQALMTALPLGANPAIMADAMLMKRFPRRTMAAAASTLPIMTGAKGSGPRPATGVLAPQLLTADRKGQVVLFDLFANHQGGYSATVVGKPGAGKSVLLNDLAFGAFAQGSVVRIIDVGRSYEKTCTLAQGQNIVFADDDVWDLNPFAFATVEAIAHRLPFPKGAGSAKNGHRAAAVSREAAAAAFGESLERIREIVIELIAEGGLTDLEKSILGRAVSAVATQAFEAGRTATLTELYEALLSMTTPTGEPDGRAADLAAMLSPYVKGGPLAKWFDGTGKRIDFRNRFMVLELEGLSGVKRLRAAALMTLILALRHEMERLPMSQGKVVIIDEAWDLMGEGACASFIESGYRRARKHCGAFITATQSVADYMKSPAARAAWSSADTRIHLRQDDASLRALDELTSGEDPAARWRKAAIESLSTISGAWSEMVIETGGMPGMIVRFFLDEYSLAAYSTHPAQRAAFEAWRAAGATVAEAVGMVAQGRLKVDAGALAELLQKRAAPQESAAGSRDEG